MECKLDKLNSIPSKELLFILEHIQCISTLYSFLFHSLLPLKVLYSGLVIIYRESTIRKYLNN